jgi:hypothetical protein
MLLDKDQQPKAPSPMKVKFLNGGSNLKNDQSHAKHPLIGEVSQVRFDEDPLSPTKELHKATFSPS